MSWHPEDLTLVWTDEYARRWELDAYVFEQTWTAMSDAGIAAALDALVGVVRSAGLVPALTAERDALRAVVRRLVDGWLPMEDGDGGHWWHLPSGVEGVDEFLPDAERAALDAISQAEQQ